tara:strand:- start:24399 stop:25112 length:714 start_codon:yes stop_codon:yes gene_type:complete
MKKTDTKVMIITGTSKGIGRHLAEYYVDQGLHVIGCSRSKTDFYSANYRHFILDVFDEKAVRAMFTEIRRDYGKLDITINNAGVASMNHSILTPIDTVRNIFETNVVGTFLVSRESAKLMRYVNYGRIINFATGAVPLKLEGEAAYASSKAAIVQLTQILSKELAEFKITVNAVGPPAIKTDLIRSVPKQKLDDFLKRHAIKRYGDFSDVTNLINFFIKPESEMVTGQVVYLGGVFG